MDKDMGASVPDRAATPSGAEPEVSGKAGIPSAVTIPHLSPNERVLLLAMDEHCSTEYECFGGKTCYPFRSLADMCPALGAHLIRRTVRSLARKGLTGFERGLMTEDGDLAGSGYGIEKAGRAIAMEARQRQDAERLDPKGDSAGLKGIAQ